MVASLRNGITLAQRGGMGLAKPYRLPYTFSPAIAFGRIICRPPLVSMGPGAETLNSRSTFQRPSRLPLSSETSTTDIPRTAPSTHEPQTSLNAANPDVLHPNTVTCAHSPPPSPGATPPLSPTSAKAKDVKYWTQGGTTRRDRLEKYVKGGTPWMGKTPAAVMERAMENIALAENLETRQPELLDVEEGLKTAVYNAEERHFEDFYAANPDPEQRLQTFAVRQVAARMLGCLGYLCATCWLPEEDCFCGQIRRHGLRADICFWVYMHPKEYLRKNNTGKLLWQVLGEGHAKLCLSGLAEQEDAMWQVLKEAGRESVWCVYPARSPSDTWVPKMDLPGRSREGEEAVEEGRGGGGVGALHFVLVDGTWTNSKALVNRLQDHASKAWGGGGMTCVALSPEGPSAMHTLRPQPQKDRICTAGAASTLLRELSQRGEMDGMGLGEVADAVDDAIGTLLGALGKRRMRNGRATLRLSGGRNKVYNGY